MEEKDIKFIKKYNKWANTVKICTTSIFIILLGVLISTSIPGIIYDKWNGTYYTNFAVAYLIIAAIIAVIIIIILFTFAIKYNLIERKKLSNLLEKNRNAQKYLDKSNNAASAIFLDHLLVDTIGERKNNIGSGIVEATSSIIIANNIRNIADELVSYLPENQRPKKVNFKIIFIVVAILSVIPTFIGINASARNKYEIINNREEVINTLKSVYQDYNPTVADFYHYEGYYKCITDINLKDGSTIEVEMDKGGDGKITNITFNVNELLQDLNNKELVIDNLLNKIETLYQRTEQYKYYYKEIFRNQVPPYKMDEEHRLDLIQKLNNIIYNGGSGHEYQSQVTQYREYEPKTSISQNIRLEVEKDDYYKVSLRLEIREKRMKDISYMDKILQKKRRIT